MEFFDQSAAYANDECIFSEFQTSFPVIELIT
jgi:hypothetical protein